ncbi:MAG: Fic family protein, partial [Clostridia bacterium]|nr:Fic family protein [Clostridia bacterium]
MFLVRGVSSLYSGRAAEVIRRMQLTNEKQRSGTVTLPLTGLTGRPFTMDAAGHISALNAALSRQANTGRQIPYTDMLRQEAHFSAMLDGAADKDSDLFDALYHVLNDSKGAVSLVTLLSAARRIAGTNVSNKKPDGTVRLEALFRFLSRSRYSPLLKGAVAHAFILATQPFIVGNGRIARFLNFTILAQGGFRFHHSLSGIIAGHSQEYIQAVRGLFLPSNAGSLTAFVGFILKMTADAIETAPEDRVRPVPDNSNDSEEALPAGETGKADVAAIPLSKTGDAVLPETALNSVGLISDNSPRWGKLSILDKGSSAHVKRTAAVV